MASEIGRCGKCDGVGIIRAFSHIAGGKCFWCNGSGHLKCATGRAAGRPSRVIAFEWGDVIFDTPTKPYAIVKEQGGSRRVDLHIKDIAEARALWIKMRRWAKNKSGPSTCLGYQAVESLACVEFA